MRSSTDAPRTIVTAGGRTNSHSRFDSCEVSRAPNSGFVKGTKSQFRASLVVARIITLDVCLHPTIGATNSRTIYFELRSNFGVGTRDLWASPWLLFLPLRHQVIDKKDDPAVALYQLRCLEFSCPSSSGLKTCRLPHALRDRKSTRLNSSHVALS